MSKLNPSFIDEMQTAVDQYVDNATIYQETNTVTFKPIWEDGITQESLDKHTNFLNKQSAIVEAGLSQIACDNYSEGGAETWNAELDLGSNLISTSVTLREEVDGNTIYGATDTIVDTVYSDDLNNWYDHFNERNIERCKSLFEEVPEDSTEE